MLSHHQNDAAAAAVSVLDSLVVALGVVAAPDYFALDCNLAVAAGVVVAASAAVALAAAVALPVVCTQNPI